jgi:hypothetical protein
LGRIGGEQGATILQPISELLGKSTREFDDHLKAIGAMIQTNPMATTELLTEGAIGVLFNTGADPAAREFQKAGDAVLQKRFGDGVTSQFIEKAVMLKNAGLDFDSEIEDIRNQGTSSTLFENLSNENNTLKEQVQELRNLVENPHLIERQTAQQTDAVKALDDEIVSRFSEGISPFRERVRWQAESPLTKVVASALLAELKNEPEYKEAVNFVKQYGSLKQGDVIPYNIEKELYKLINKGKGRFGTTAIEINKELRGLTATSRNAQVEKKVKETTKPKAVPVTPQKSYSNLTSFAGANDPVKAELERIYSESDRQRAA